MLPPKLTGPHAAQEIPPITTYRPPSLPPPAREHANDVLDSFLDTHIEALQDDPDVVLQTEFDSNTLLGTLMNNLRDQKQEIKGRAITNEHYVPGGKSLLELDQEAARRIQMGKALSSRGGRNWGSSHVGSSSPRRTSHGSPYEDELFESVSLAEMEYKEQDEDVPLAMVRNRIVTQRQRCGGKFGRSDKTIEGGEDKKGSSGGGNFDGENGEIENGTGGDFTGEESEVEITKKCSNRVDCDRKTWGVELGGRIA